MPVREYRFSNVANSVRHPGAQQAIKYGDRTTPRDNQIGDTLSDCLVNFANTGNPNGNGCPLGYATPAAATRS